MIGKHKPFSKSLFNGHDPKSRTIVKDYLAKNQIMVNDNPNKFGVDLISEDGTLKIEVEHRTVWKEEEFPFALINVPERKGKFFTEECVSYAILSENYSHIGMISGKELKKYIVDENLAENRNKYVREGEYFYKIPKEAFKWDKI